MSTPSFAGVLMMGLAVAAVSSAGTLLMRRYLVAKAVFDIPNERSSHVVPTPRGGGVAIVTVACFTWLILAAGGLLSTRVSIALVVGGGAVAIVGWLDDRHSVSALVRLAVHFAAAVSAVIVVAPAIGPLGGVLDTGAGGLLGRGIWVVVLVWLTNIYNFMDGIDGLAAGEALIVATLAAALAWWNGSAGDSIALLVLAGAAGGFLVWNWPPARIFMGDVGSGFLGMSFGILAIVSSENGAPTTPLWMLLLGVFIADTSITLFRRFLRGERWYFAHRSHSYQRLVQSGWTHRAVTSSALLLTLALGALAALGVWFPSLANGALMSGGALLLVAWGLVERRSPI